MTPKQSALARFDEKFAGLIWENDFARGTVSDVKSFLSEMYDEAEEEGYRNGFKMAKAETEFDKINLYTGRYEQSIRQSAIKEVIGEIPDWKGTSREIDMKALKQQLKDKYGIEKLGKRIRENSYSSNKISA